MKFTDIFWFFVAGCLLAIALALSGCGSVPVTQDMTSKANFGVKPSNEAAANAIRGYFDKNLISPARFQCTGVSDKAWAKADTSANHQFGYLVVCGIPDKNRRTCSAGSCEYVFLFNGPTLQVFDYSRYYSIGVEPRGILYDLVR